MRRWAVPLIAVMAVGLLGVTTQTNSYAEASVETATRGPSQGGVASSSDSGNFTFYAVYDQLADTDADNLLIDHTAISGDGTKLIFGARDASTKETKVFTANLDSGQVSPVPLPSEISQRQIDEFTMSADGSRAFFRVDSCCDSTKYIYKLENGALAKILDSSTNDDLKKGSILQLQATANGEYVYFLDDAPNDNDVWRIRHDGSGLEIVINDTEVPRNGGKGAQVGDFAVSNNGSVIAFTLFGYWLPRNGFSDNGYRKGIKLFARINGGYTPLTQDNESILSDELAISGDGSTITFAADGKRYSISPGGGDRTLLGVQGHNTAGPALTYDGSFMVYTDNEADGGSILYTDGSGRYALFPRWDVGAITLAIHSGLSMSDSGHRISFVVQTGSFPTKNALYVGYLNTPEAVQDVPSVQSITFDPPSLPNNDPEAPVKVLSHVEDPQGLSDISSTYIDQLIDGKLVYVNTLDGPFHVRSGGQPRDDGEAQDQSGNDGIFSAEGFPSKIVQQFDHLTVRVSFMDKSRSVTVADTILPVGVYVATSEPTPSPTLTRLPASDSNGVVISVQSRTASPGGTVQVPIQMEKGKSISSLGFNFTYDSSVLEVTSVIKGGVTGPATFTYNADTPGVVRFGYASNKEMSGAGSVAAVAFKVKGDRGTVSHLALSDGLVTDGSGSSLPVQLVDGNVTVEQRLSGDGNGDGQVTVLDALIALRMFVQVIPEDQIMDVNGDSRVTPEDARQILAMASPGYRN